LLDNPNALRSHSPGLRGTSYPGSPSDKHPQPQRGCGQFVSIRARDVCHNAVGVVSISRPDTQGRRCTPTLGWRPQSLWDCSERGSATSATRSASACNVAAETSNHLRAANLLRLAESRAVRESQRDSVPKPRVARHELPWVIVRQTPPTATRLRPIRSRPRAPDLSHNAVGVDSISKPAPKVGVARQPWAGGPNPFGIVRSAGLRRLRPAVLPHAMLRRKHPTISVLRTCCDSQSRGRSQAQTP